MSNQQKVGRQFFSGNTLEQAILAAARHHGLDPEQVAYSQRDKKHGFLNIRRRFVIDVDPEAPRREAQALAQGVPSEEGLAVKPESDQELESPASSFIPFEEGRTGEAEQDRATWRGEENSWTAEDGSDPEISALFQAVEELNGLLGTDFEVSIQKGEEGLEAELTGPDSSVLRENRGGGLAAAEHLVTRMVRGLSGHGVLCRIDSEGFRESHERRLAELARETAEEARRDGRELRLEPMNPGDRRLVHMALADDPSVRTESDGEGFLKRVRILPL